MTRSSVLSPCMRFSGSLKQSLDEVFYVNNAGVMH